MELNRPIPFAVAPLEKELKAAYKVPKGTLKVGLKEDFTPYPPMWVGGASEKDFWIFENLTSGADSTTTYSWSVSDVVLTGDPENNYNLVRIPSIGKWDIPVLKAVRGAAESVYQYASQEDIWGNVSLDKCLLVGSAEILPLTNADYHYGGNFVAFENGNYAMGSGEAGMEGFPFYFECSGFKVLSKEKPVKAKGVITYYEKPITPLVVQSISVVGYSRSFRPLAAGCSLTLEIRKLDEKGKVEMRGEPLLVATATATNVKQCIEGEPAYRIDFPFTGVDGTGFSAAKDFVMDRACAVVITGFDREGCDFGLYCANGVGAERCGTSWLILDNGSAGTYVFGEEEQKPRFDAFVYLNGFYTYFSLVNDYAYVPSQGGAAEFFYEGASYRPQLISNFPATGENAVKIVSEIPSWLTVTPDDSYFDEFNVIIYNVEGEPLSQEVWNRSATLVFDNHGFRKSIEIIQQGCPPGGSVATHSADLYKVIRRGYAFILSYPQKVTSVTITDVCGRRVTRLDLPVGGSYVIPISKLADGLNIFKFNGDLPVVVKAIHAK